MLYLGPKPDSFRQLRRSLWLRGQTVFRVALVHTLALVLLVGTTALHFLSEAVTQRKCQDFHATSTCSCLHCPVLSETAARGCAVKELPTDPEGVGSCLICKLFSHTCFETAAVPILGLLVNHEVRPTRITSVVAPLFWAFSARGPPSIV